MITSLLYIQSALLKHAVWVKRNFNDKIDITGIVTPIERSTYLETIDRVMTEYLSNFNHIDDVFVLTNSENDHFKNMGGLPIFRARYMEDVSINLVYVLDEGGKLTEALISDSDLKALKHVHEYVDVIKRNLGFLYGSRRKV